MFDTNSLAKFGMTITAVVTPAEEGGYVAYIRKLGSTVQGKHKAHAGWEHPAVPDKEEL